MSKPRGNKKSQAEVAQKEAEIIDHLKEIPPGKALAEAAGLPVSTLYDYISRLKAKGLSLDQTRNPEKYLALCEEQDAVLRKMEEWLLEQKIAPEIVREWRAVRKDIAELWGLDAAKKTIISVNLDAEKLTQGFYPEFMRRTKRKFKFASSWQRLWDWIDAQPSDYDEKLLEGNNADIQ